MDFYTLGVIIFCIVINIARLLINASIYRVEYESNVQMDDIARDFSFEENRRKDEAGLLFLLSLFTVFWLNYTKPENKRKIIVSNTLSFVFVSVLIVVFIFDI